MNTLKTNTPSSLGEKEEGFEVNRKPEPAVKMAKKGAARGKPRAPTRFPDFDVVKSFLNYCPDTGEFRWAKTVNRHKQGDLAGSKDNLGYWIIGFNRQQYKAHRLAWLLHYGVQPSAEIDHRNLDKCDNRISNLREANRFNNLWNFPVPRTNTSGFKGASFDERSGQWRARIQANGKTHNLGYFADPESAGLAYDEASRRLHGEFSRTNQ